MKARNRSISMSTVASKEYTILTTLTRQQFADAGLKSTDGEPKEKGTKNSHALTCSTELLLDSDIHSNGFRS